MLCISLKHLVEILCTLSISLPLCSIANNFCKEKSNGIHDAHEEQQKAQIDLTNHRVGDQP